MACSGPRTLKASAQVANGLVIAETGYTPEDIAYVRALVEEGCAEVNRDSAEFNLWWTSQVSFSDDLVQRMATAIGATFWITWGSAKGKRVAPDYIPKLCANSHNLATWEHDRGEQRAIDGGLTCSRQVGPRRSTRARP